MQESRRTYLLEQYKKGASSFAEKRELWEIVRQPESEAWLKDDIDREILHAEALAEPFPVIIKDADAKDVLHTILETHAVAPAHRVHFLKTNWFRYAAAIIILLGTATALVRVFTHRNNDLATINQASSHQPSDIAPGTNKAILTIGNNQPIDLASNKTGVTVNNTINYNDGEAINGLSLHSTLSIQHLTLSTPRGGQYQAVLPDGTKVWLNAASSIKFPSAFKGDSREVEIAGEAYLEVAKNTKQPFFVHTNKETIQVLGTSFNVNAYEDEESEKTTLIEGSVRVMSDPRTVISTPTKEGEKSLKMPTGSNSGDFSVARSSLLRNDGSGVILKPGQQSIITNQINQVNQRSIVVQTINADEVVAWKNNLFNFNKSDIPAVMRQLSRWYDVDIEYKGKAPEQSFTGQMQRSLSLDRVLTFLEKSQLHIERKGRTIIVY